MSLMHPEQPLARAGDSGTPAEQLILRFLWTMPSGHTRANYSTDLGGVRLLRPGVKEPGESKIPPLAPSWLGWCGLLGAEPVSGVIEDHAATWARHMEAVGLAPATIARRLAAVSSWYKWLIRNGHAEINPVANLKRPNVDPDTTLTPGLDRKQTLAVLAYADRATTPAAPRNAALIYLLIFTGARISELTGAVTGDLGINRGHRVLNITGKGNEKASLVIPPPAAERLDRYLTWRGDITQLPAVRDDATDRPARNSPLIATESGRRLLDADAWRIVRSLAGGAGLPDELVRKLGPHAAGRHTFATLALDAETPLRDVQDALRHKDPRTTRRYDRARGLLDRSPGYKLTQFLATDGQGGTDE